MSRRKVAVNRECPPDSKYKSELVTRLVNIVMVDGKKSTAERAVYSAFDVIEQRTGKDALRVFKKALDNVKPAIEVKSRRVGGSTYQVPVEVRPERRVTLALRWIVGYSNKRPERGFGRKLAAELLDASNGVGASVKKMDDTHKMAEANKAFAHYRW
ncbi:MAG: 30S ribosomal protein S7 [Candidatus Schekmanbacteria bacterium]|nr:30S ribosomal protein S7 [Candidatus Schekmanbacteria bacterium]